MRISWEIFKYGAQFGNLNSSRKILGYFDELTNWPTANR